MKTKRPHKHTARTCAATLTCTALLFAAASQASITVFGEDFEDADVRYSVTTNVGTGDNLERLAAGDYFGRIAPPLALPTAINYTNVNGSGFYALQDTDGTPAGNVDRVMLEWLDINVRNLAGLTLSWLLAEDRAADGNGDWDASTRMRLAVRRDDGVFEDLFGIAGARNPDNPTDRTNEAAAVDTNLDGVGDGPALNEAFTRFDVPVPDARRLAIRVTFNNLDAADEDLAFDHLLLTARSVAAPGSAGLLALGAWLLAARVRFRSQLRRRARR